MNNLRQSLLQHIQSVQQEIARLQLERQRTQHTSASELPELPQALAGAVRACNSHASAEMLVSPDDKAIKQLAPTTLSRPATLLQSPELPLAPEEARVAVPPLLESQTARWNRPVQWQPSIGHTSARSVAMQSTIPATGTPASATVPMLGSGSLLLNSSIQAPLRGQSPTRLDGPVRTMSPARVAAAWQSPTKIAMSTMPAKYDVGPNRNSLGSGRGRVSRVPVQQDALLLAALRIQRFWRRRLAKRGTKQESGSSNGRVSKKRRFAPVHLAATRIQRMWKLQQWRRKFVDYSQRECGWVGSLEWLQHHNLLYGTELADAEDVKWWLQQRATAPLDREVDPWGSERLLEHLNRMWYGGRAAEVVQQQQQQQQQEQLLQQQQQQQQLLQQQQSRRSERETLRERQWSRDQRSEDIFMAFAVSPQDGQVVDSQAWGSSKVIMSSGRAQSGATSGVVSSLRAVSSAERGTVRQVSLGHGKDTWRAATSLSPRRSLRSDRDVSGVRESEEILTAFAVAVQDANGHGSSKTIMTSGHGPQGGVASSLRAVPSAERSAGGRQISANGKDSWRAATSLSPRQETWTANGGTPAASSGADSLAARLKGAVLGGAPPPAMHGYQRSYRVASHSPPQTHRAARTTMPVTPNLVSGMRPRSPVQSISSATPSSSRLSLPSSGSMQSRSLGQVQRHTSSMNRALSGSPPPLVAGVGRSPVASRR